MGFDTERFENQDFAGRLKCSICNGVFEDPVQCPEEHIYCRACITTWLETNGKCHEDHHQLSVAQLSPGPKIIREFLAQLIIKCGHARSGCSASVKLPDLASHMVDCEFALSKSVGIQADIESKEVNHLKRKIEELNEECEVSAKRIKTLEDVKPVLRIKVEKVAKEVQTTLLSVDIENLFEAEGLSAIEARLKESDLCNVELRKRNKVLNENFKKSNDDLMRVRELRKSLQDKLDEAVKKIATSSNLSPPTTLSESGHSSTPKCDGAKSSSRAQQVLDDMLCRGYISLRLLQLILEVNRQMMVFNGDFSASDLETTANGIKNAFKTIGDGPKKVLNLIECPLIAVCLATMLTKCTFIISHRLKAPIVESGFSELIESGRLVVSEPFKSKFVRFETLGCPNHGPYDLIFYGGGIIHHRVRQSQLKVGGRIYSALNNFFLQS